MKDECAREVFSEAVCLRSKMYSILLDNDKKIKKAKGTTKAVTKKQITHQNYKDALFKKFAFRHGMNMLRSKNHKVFEFHLNKTTLSPFNSSVGLRRMESTPWHMVTKISEATECLAAQPSTPHERSLAWAHQTNNTQPAPLV